MQAEGNVDGADVDDTLEVRDAGTLQLGGSRGVTDVYPAHGLLGIDKVHSHGLLGGNGGQPGRGSTQRSAADVIEVSNQQHRQTIHWVWGGDTEREGKMRARRHKGKEIGRGDEDK